MVLESIVGTNTVFRYQTDTTSNIITSIHNSDKTRITLAEGIFNEANEQGIHGLGELRALWTNAIVSMAGRQRADRDYGHIQLGSIGGH